MTDPINLGFSAGLASILPFLMITFFVILFSMLCFVYYKASGHLRKKRRVKSDVEEVKSPKHSHHKKTGITKKLKGEPEKMLVKEQHSIKKSPKKDVDKRFDTGKSEEQLVKERDTKMKHEEELKTRVEVVNAAGLQDVKEFGVSKPKEELTKVSHERVASLKKISSMDKGEASGSLKQENKSREDTEALGDKKSKKEIQEESGQKALSDKKSKEEIQEESENEVQEEGNESCEESGEEPHRTSEESWKRIGTGRQRMDDQLSSVSGRESVEVSAGSRKSTAVSRKLSKKSAVHRESLKSAVRREPLKSAVRMKPLKSAVRREPKKSAVRRKSPGKSAEQSSWAVNVKRFRNEESPDQMRKETSGWQSTGSEAKSTKRFREEEFSEVELQEHKSQTKSVRQDATESRYTDSGKRSARVLSSRARRMRRVLRPVELEEISDEEFSDEEFSEYYSDDIDIMNEDDSDDKSFTSAQSAYL